MPAGVAIIWKRGSKLMNLLCIQDANSNKLDTLGSISKLLAEREMCNGIKSKALKHENVPLGTDAPALRSLACTCNVMLGDKNEQ